MELAKVTSKGQVTIPIEIRKKLGIKNGDKILFVEESGRIYMMNLAIRLTHPHYLVLRRLSYLLCQTLLISVYPLAGVKMKKCISVIYTDIHSIHGIRQKNVGLCPRNCLFLKNSRQEKKYGTAVYTICAVFAMFM